MAHFAEAYNILKPNEGGYRDVAWDLGGETYRGITRKYWPGWSGWDWIDNYKSIHGSIPAGKVFPELESRVMDFYEANYWNKIKGNQIQNQQLANMVFDFSVQSGYAGREINKALGLGTANSITSDTLTALNNNPKKAFSKIKQQRINYYKGLNNQGYISDRDITGILARVRRLAAPVAAVGTGIIAIAALLFF